MSSREGEVRVPWKSSITEVGTDTLQTCGIDQRTIMREFSFEETVFLLLTRRRPDEVERTMLRLVLVSTMSHGITGQSTMAVLAAADCRSGFLPALIAGFSAGGGIHLGATAATMVELQRLAALSDDDLVREIEDRLAKRERLPGFGHRFHKRDPRAEEIFKIADEQGFNGRYVTLARRIQRILEERRGKALNIAGANAAILLDLGFDPTIAHLFIVLGRSTMFAAAYLERVASRPPFTRLEVFDIVEKD